MKKSKVEIPMFNRVIIKLEGTPEELRKGVNQILGKYRCRWKKKTKLYEDLQPSCNPGRALFPKIDEERLEEYKGPRPIIITINTEADAFHCHPSCARKNRVVAITHEIRHAIDRIIGDSKIEDPETPAYLTGWVCGELLVGEEL